MSVGCLNEVSVGILALTGRHDWTLGLKEVFCYILISTPTSESFSITYEVLKVRISDKKCTSVHFHKPSGHFPEVKGP